MNTHEKFRLANDPSTEQEVLSELSFSDNAVIRSSIAANTSSSLQTLSMLSRDKNVEVIKNLLKNPIYFSGVLYIEQ